MPALKFELVWPLLLQPTPGVYEAPRDIDSLDDVWQGLESHSTLTILGLATWPPQVSEAKLSQKTIRCTHVNICSPKEPRTCVCPTNLPCLQPKQVPSPETWPGGCVAHSKGARYTLLPSSCWKRKPKLSPVTGASMRETRTQSPDWDSRSAGTAAHVGCRWPSLLSSEKALPG